MLDSDNEDLTEEQLDALEAQVRIADAYTRQDWNDMAKCKGDVSYFWLLYCSARKKIELKLKKRLLMKPG